MSEAYWKCPNCGLELSFEEVCKSGGHSHETEIEKAAKKAAITGNRTDLFEKLCSMVSSDVLKLRRQYL